MVWSACGIVGCVLCAVSIIIIIIITICVNVLAHIAAVPALRPAMICRPRGAVARYGTSPIVVHADLHVGHAATAGPADGSAGAGCIYIIRADGTLAPLTDITGKCQFATLSKSST